MKAKTLEGFEAERDAFSDMWNFMEKNWDKLGLTPLYLYRLLERGYEYEDIDMALTATIGRDYAGIKVSEWIDRLQGIGIEIDDADPFIDLMDRLIFSFLAEMGLPITKKTNEAMFFRNEAK